jgi:hypothetical protein
VERERPIEYTNTIKRVVNRREREWTHVPHRLQIGHIFLLAFDHLKNHVLALYLLLWQRGPCLFRNEPMPLFVALAQLVLLELANGILVLATNGVF